MTLKSHCNHRHTATDSVQRSKHCVRQYSYKSLCYYCARPHLIDQKRPKPCRVQPGLMFHTTDRVRMEQRPSEGDVQVDNTESRLRELALKWFTETQAPLILHNGNFPEWFQGFISRKDAEEHLKDKELGCFLIRLSDKTTGYILSYKGRDRCRHFVINQNKHGGFMVTGDTEMHDTLTSLIEHYRISPIEPFGEYLTLSCFEFSTSELYDVVHYAKDKPGVNVKAVKDIWTHQSEKSQTIHPPALPSKAIKNIQDFPHQQRKGPPLKTVSLELKHNPENVIYTKIDLSKPEMCARTSTESKYGASWGDDHKSPTDSTVSQGTIYSELIMPNCRSQSMPFLDNNKEEEEQICRTSQVQLHIGTDRLSGLSSSLDELCNSSLYHLAGTSGNQLTVGKPARSGVNILDSDATYAEIPHEPNAVFFVDDNTYEQIPDSWVFTTRSEKKSQRTNSYEALTDLKPKQTFLLRTFKNEKWRWLSPEYWKK